MPAADAPVLVADVGGTNTRVALARAGGVLTDTTGRYRNADYAGLETVLAEYLSQHRNFPARAAIALAGTVRGPTAEMTNLGWRVHGPELARMTGIREVALLNDLQAQGHALHRLPPDSLHPIRGAPAAAGTRLVIGLGTGVNAASVHPHGGGHIVPPAEAGHVHLPQHTDEDQRLARWLKARRGLASVEDVLSGTGLERLYAYHAESAAGAPAKSAGAIMDEMGACGALATGVGRHYARLLAQYTAGLALVTLPFGGIYYIGGVARAITPHLARFGFDAAFTDMGRMSDLVAQFPVALVQDDFAALTGCAAYLATTPR